MKAILSIIATICGLGWYGARKRYHRAEHQIGEDIKVFEELYEVASEVEGSIDELIEMYDGLKLEYDQLLEQHTNGDSTMPDFKYDNRDTVDPGLRPESYVPFGSDEEPF